MTEAKVSLCKCADSPEPSLLAQNGIQSLFEPPRENFELWRRLEGSKAQTRPSNCADSPKPSLFAGMTPKNSEYDRKISHSQTAEKPMAPRGIATQQSRGTRRYRFFTFYASTSAENCHHQLVLAPTGAFTLTSVY